MYNIVKLFTEEPEKLERVGILFLKFIMTLFISSTFFGFNISISHFFENPIPKDYTISNFLLFVISLILIWFVIWNLIAELFLGEILISLLSRIGNKKSIFLEILGLLNIIKKDSKNLSPAKNVISFNEFLQKYTEENEKFINESKSRVRQIFIVASVLYITLLFSNDLILPQWLKWVGAFVVLNFLIGSIILNQVINYFTKNLDEMKKQFSRLSFSQMIINSLDQNPFIKENYKRDGLWARIRLQRITDNDSLPESFKFYSFYYWNDTLTESIIDWGFKQYTEKKIVGEKEGMHFNVIVSNIKPNEENIKFILSQPSFAYLLCENEEQIYKNLEVLLFKVTKGKYRIN
jgi:hypothetical protein